jgi:hypothetical protein
VDGEKQNPLHVYQKVVPFAPGRSAGYQVSELSDDDFAEEEVIYEASAAASK